MRIGLFAAALALVGVGAPASATILSFDATGAGTCGGTTCTDGTKVQNTYGDVTNVIDLSYKTIVGYGNSANASNAFVYYQTAGYSTLNQVGADSAAGNVLEVKLLATDASASTTNVGVTSFDVASLAAASPVTVRIYDLNYANLLYSTIVPQTSTTVTANVSAANGLRIQLGSASAQVAIDNLNYYIGSPPGNISGAPEPASWAMMLGGFGVIGASLRRRGRAMRAAH